MLVPIPFLVSPQNFIQMFKLDLEKAEEPDQIANICWIMKQQESSRKTSPSAIDYIKPFDCVDYNKL